MFEILVKFDTVVSKRLEYEPKSARCRLTVSKAASIALIVVSASEAEAKERLCNSPEALDTTAACDATDAPDAADDTAATAAIDVTAARLVLSSAAATLATEATDATDALLAIDAALATDA